MRYIMSDRNTNRHIICEASMINFNNDHVTLIELLHTCHTKVCLSKGKNERIVRGFYSLINPTPTLLYVRYLYFFFFHYFYQPLFARSIHILFV